MKLKKYSLIALITGFCMLAFTVVFPVFYAYVKNDPSTAIIGGADSPTYDYLRQNLFDGFILFAESLGVVLIIMSAFCLLFSKTVKKHCKFTTSIITLGLSASGSLGLVCFFRWFVIAAFNESGKYPIEHAVSVSLGTVCFVVFVLLLLLYFSKRKNQWSFKGLLIDVLTSFVCMPSFMFLYSYLENVIS